MSGVEGSSPLFEAVISIDGSRDTDGGVGGEEQ